MGPQPQRPTPVAQYLRMSSEHQRYSTTNQREAIETYVAERGMQVVRTFEDSGRSGLTLIERPALQELLAEVHSPERRFEAVVVFDVSRWGRFQDVDESAYYEFVCRRAGVQVIYCAEPFGDVPGPMAVVIKSVKRAMAAEYSRELGVKVHAGQCQLTRRGFHMGGFPSFGLRRVLVSETGEVKGQLRRREQKSLQTDRVVLELGDPLDVALVRHIFGLFVRKRMREPDIARYLNWLGFPGRVGLHPWCSQGVRQVLRNEEYVGNLVYNRRSCSLKTPWVMNPPEQWVRAMHCFPGIVSQATFDEAQRLIFENNRRPWTEEELLNKVRQLYAEHGVVSPNLLRKNGFPDSCNYIYRFGSLADACDAAGVPTTDQLRLQRRILSTRHALKIEVLERLEQHYRAAGIGFFWSRTTRRACIEDGPTVSVRSVQAFASSRKPYWLVTPDRRVSPDFALVARVALDRPEILDFYLLPACETRNVYVRMDGDPAHAWADRYHYAKLDGVFQALEAGRRASGGEMVPRLTIALAKRRRRVLEIIKRHEIIAPRLRSRPGGG